MRLSKSIGTIAAAAVLAVPAIGLDVPAASGTTHEYWGFFECVLNCRKPPCNQGGVTNVEGVICLPANHIAVASTGVTTIRVINDLGMSSMRFPGVTVRICQDFDNNNQLCNMGDVDVVDCGNNAITMRTQAADPLSKWTPTKDTYVLIGGPLTATFFSRCTDHHFGTHGFVTHP